MTGPEEEAARRRELQRRAFAPGGEGLTAEEAAELRRLTAAVVHRPFAASALGTEERTETADPSGTGAGRPSRATETADEPLADPIGGQAVAEPVAVEMPAPPDEGAAPRRRRSWRGLLLAAVTVVALAVGLGIGRLLPAPPATSAPPAMTAAQQKVARDLAEVEELDEGSMVFAGEKYGAAVWTATRDSEPCVIMTLGERHDITCGPLNDDTLAGAIVLRLMAHEDDFEVVVNAAVVHSADGVPRVIVSRFEMPYAADDWKQGYPEELHATVETLLDAGFDWFDLSIVGYDGDLPVWVGAGEELGLMIVEPDTLAVQQACVPSRDRAELMLPYRGSEYRVGSADRWGSSLVVARRGGEG